MPLSVDKYTPYIPPATGIFIVIRSPSVGFHPRLNVHFAGKYLGLTPDPLSCPAVPVPVL